MGTFSSCSLKCRRKGIIWKIGYVLMETAYFAGIKQNQEGSSNFIPPLLSVYLRSKLVSLVAWKNYKRFSFNIKFSWKFWFAVNLFNSFLQADVEVLGRQGQEIVQRPAHCPPSPQSDQSQAHSWVSWLTNSLQNFQMEFPLEISSGLLTPTATDYHYPPMAGP